MVLDRIRAMLEMCGGEWTVFPPTLLYNENWLLRVVLGWFEATGSQHPQLGFREGARWYSEARLVTAFRRRSRGDTLCETHTHADGVIGHFGVGGSGKEDLVVCPNATQLAVLEAKMFSRLSRGVKNAPKYDQAARTVACMAQLLMDMQRHPTQVESLGFFLIAPECQIKRGLFDRPMCRDSIRGRIWERVQEYGGDHRQWFRDWFEPTMKQIKIDCLSWEDVIEYIRKMDEDTGKEIRAFYEQCVRFNERSSRSTSGRRTM